MTPLSRRCYSFAMFCPSCESEYRPGFTRCSTCDVDLVASLPKKVDGHLHLDEALKKGEAIHIARAQYAEALTMVEVLSQGGVAAAVQGDPGSCDHPGGACQQFWVAIHKDSLDKARAIFDREFQELAAKQGLPAAKAAPVDLDAGAKVSCPACGFEFQGSNECPDCGLFLGAE